MTTASPVDGRFALTDHFGSPVTQDSYRGRYRLVFFGFTHCKAVCPRALARISAALDQLGPMADEIQPLYITVDPERDSPPVMRAFLEAAHPRILGLTGDRPQIDAAKQAFRVFAARKAGQAVDDYDVPHTAITYLMTPTGDYLTHFGDAMDADELARRLRHSLAA